MSLYLIVLYPVMLLIAGAWDDALVVWSAVATVMLVPTFVVLRAIPSVDGVDAMDRRHPSYGRAFWIALAAMIVAAGAFVLVHQTLT